MKISIDKSGVLEKLIKELIKKLFPELGILNYLYTWRDTEKIYEGQIVMSKVYKLSNKDRDLFDFDCRFEVDENMWNSLSKKEKYKLAFHELCHIKIECEHEEEDKDKDENENEGRLARVDKEGRIIFHIVPHDVILMRFKKELKKFGMDKNEDKMRRFLNKVSK